ncbi:MAG TPA: hypothetical protein PK018_09350, partial [Candidatus Competibacter sp.]|nr:hypothetical protein [Candidatus Competibacter sp.]
MLDQTPHGIKQHGKFPERLAARPTEFQQQRQRRLVDGLDRHHLDVHFTFGIVLDRKDQIIQSLPSVEAELLEHRRRRHLDGNPAQFLR